MADAGRDPERAPLTPVALAEWDEAHARWGELVGFVADERMVDWALADGRSLLPGGHALVALLDGVLVGFLVFLVQRIGPEDGCPPVAEAGEIVTEAKIRAFAVRGDVRRRGIGTLLQRRALERARELGCYQMRSQSDAGRGANVQLKLRLGFGVHPAVRTIAGEERSGYYFVKSLRP